MAKYVTKAWIKTAWNKALPDAVKVGLVGIGGMLEQQAAANSPVGKYPPNTGRIGGRLRGSITYAVNSPEGDEWTNTHAAMNMAGDEVSMPGTPHTLHVGTNVEYAPFVEYGHWTRGKKRFIPGQRYLTRAFDERQSEFGGVFIKAIEQAVLRHGR